MSTDTSNLLRAKNLSPNPDLFLDIELNGHSLGEGHDWETIIVNSVHAALRAGGDYENVPIEIFVELVSDERSQSLNRDYRGKNQPTNVLSFPGTEPDDLKDAVEFSLGGGPPVPLGDLIVAVDVVLYEAAEQKKPIEYHFAHLIIHGVLHLLGYDHIDDDEAEAMEALERKILAQFDIPDPYKDVIE
tara:strand:+ start:364 stop:927 length:564 start_codon:yes stop_codon:yes gene_type:complete